MQTLNVGAGRSDDDYKASEDQSRGDLRTEALNCGNLFFWAAGMAAIPTALVPMPVSSLVRLGSTDLLAFYGRTLGPFHSITVIAATATWIVALVGLGFAARSGHKWAFLVGIILYALDMIALIVTFSILAFGVHSFFVYKWYQGRRLLKDLDDGVVSQQL